VIHLAGSIGLGLVWGWVAARLIWRARWDVAARVLLGLLAQGLVSVYLASELATVWAAAAAATGALICYGWLRRLEGRRRWL
jgi:hypothetical protein